MARICKRCQRRNPTTANYCYHDGALLEDQPGAGAGAAAAAVEVRPVDVGAKPFTTPFFFPSGRVCHNFNELALACSQDVTAGLDALRQGFLTAFLSAQGRADLAAAAQTAARTVGLRGLDEFLGTLPCTVLEPARLRIDRQLIDLGTLTPGEDRRIELLMHNEGMRLLAGSAVCSASSWLALGDKPVVKRKLFQCTDQAMLVIRVQGRYLRSFSKPQEAEVLIESNGGTATVVVRVMVSVQPFSEGVLAGAKTPRQLAEKALAAPKEAALLIENGAVANWYQGNGWTYPVVGPTATGPAAVQQLFEALGLSRPPRVDLSEERIQLSGAPGQMIEYVLAVITQENRPAVAYGSSDQPWLHVGRPVYRGRSVTLPLTVSSVPFQAGATLNASVSVTANGNQRFTVPVTLAIRGTPVPVSSMGEGSRRALPPLPPIPADANPPPPAPPASWAPPPERKHRLIRLVLACWCLLVVGLLVVVGVRQGVFQSVLAKLHALVRRAPAGSKDGGPLLKVAFQDNPTDQFVGAATMTFGLVLPHDKTDTEQPKHLTRDTQGRTNNTCYRLDGREVLLGYEGGSWVIRGESLDSQKGHERVGNRSIWQHEGAAVIIAQHVEIIRGAQGKLDTCMVRYEIENRDSRSHKVGLRFLLDTFVGGRDGVPFVIPGQPRWCDTSADLNGADVPDFLEAMESDDLKSPGTVALLGLRVGKRMEVPARVTVGCWPDKKLSGSDARCLGNLTRWEVPVLSLKTLADSAVTMYWAEKDLAPGARREVGFTYGLGILAGDTGQGRLALAVGGSFAPGGELTVTASVKGSPSAGESLTLEVPAGLTLRSGQSQPVPAPPIGDPRAASIVTWKLVSPAGAETTYPIQVRSSAGTTQALQLTIHSNHDLD
jgi:hypothetical protein